MSACEKNVYATMSFKGIPSAEEMKNILISLCFKTGARIKVFNEKEDTDGSFGCDAKLECLGRPCLLKKLNVFDLKDRATIVGSCNQEAE